MVLKFLVTFGTGIYCGIYLSQNYDVPKVYEPKELLSKLQDFVGEMNDKYRKDKQTNDSKRDN